MRDLLDAGFEPGNAEALDERLADLDPAGKARLEAIDVELSKVTTKFSENVLDSTNAFELYVEDERKLAGLPPSAIAAARVSSHTISLPSRES